MVDAQAVLDERCMRRALRAAERGQPSPSPRVGALLARGAELLATAHRAAPDGPHPLLQALQRTAADGDRATAYCTLEPQGAEALACARALAHAGVTRLVTGCSERSRQVSPWRAYGIEHVAGVLATEAERLVADVRKVQREGLPLVTLKAAVTLDGRTAARSGESKWITGPESRKEAHRLRVQHDAILVGVGTVLADDPELTARSVRGRSPLRVVLDSRLRTPLKARLVTGATQVPTLILHARSAPTTRIAKLRAAGVQLASVKRGPGGVGLDIAAVLRELARRGVVRLLVEGGAHIHAALLEGGFADRAAVFVAPRILGDAKALPLAAGRRARSLQNAFVLPHPELVRCGNDVLFRGDIARPVNTTTRRSRRNSAGPR